MDSLHVICDAHCTALVYGKTLAPLDPQVTGAMRIALSLRTGGSMTLFRQCLRDEIASRLRILQGTPPRDAIAYEKRALMVFASHGAGTTTRRALHAMCPNVDWRSSEVEFYVATWSPPEHQLREHVIEHLSNGLVVALASAQPSCYNRSKWRGSDLVIDDLGIFECVHRLLSTSHVRFCASHLSGSAAQMHINLAQPLRHCDRRSTADGDDDDDNFGSGAEEGGGAAQESVRNEGSHGKSSAAAGDSMTGPDWAKISAVDRSKGVHFLARIPPGFLVLIRFLMEPLRSYLNQQFGRVPERWRLREMAKVAEALKHRKTCQDKTRVEMVAAGDDDARGDRDALRRCRPVGVDASVESHGVDEGGSPSGCASRMGCGFDKLLRSRHTRFPVQLFRLLSESPMAAEFLRVRECMMDRWTLEVKRQWPTFDDEELLQVLYTIASVLAIDVAHVEARHASLRRFLVSGSVHTHTHVARMTHFGAQWLFSSNTGLPDNTAVRGCCAACGRKRKPVWGGGGAQDPSFARKPRLSSASSVQASAGRGELGSASTHRRSASPRSTWG